MCPTFLLFKNLENKLLTACTSLARMLAYQAAVENATDGYKFYYNSGGTNRLLYYDVVEATFI